MSDIIPAGILLQAYMDGVFPMGNEDGSFDWYSPTQRGIIPLDDRFHLSRGLKKALRKKPFELRVNTAFREVMLGCAERETTWINEDIIQSYYNLFQLGFAISVECWDEEGLQGGLYGVALGKVFFGESMFSRKTDASKIALVYLVDLLREKEFTLLDTQWLTSHLQTFGGYEVSREEYMKLLKAALKIKN